MPLIEFKINKKLAVVLLVSLLLERHKQVLDAVHGEGRLAKDAHDLEHRPANFEFVLDDGNEAVGDDGDVYLDADGVLGLTPEPLDLEMLLDPLEKVSTTQSPRYSSTASFAGRSVLVTWPFRPSHLASSAIFSSLMTTSMSLLISRNLL